MSDPKCTTASISQSGYRFTNSTTRSQLYVPLQCLLKQQGLYPHTVTGNWNKYTVSGLRSFQERVDHPLRMGFTRRDWISLITAGNHGTVLTPGSRATDVLRVQRAMNAASPAALKVHKTYDTATRNAVIAYQRKLGISATGNVTSLTWAAMKTGRF